MRKTLFAAALFLCGTARAQSDLQVLAEELASVPSVAAVPAVLAVPALELKERWPRKQYTYELKVSSDVLGTIVGAETGYELRDAAGTLLASAKDVVVKKGGRIIKVSDGAGSALGTISMTRKPWCGEKSFSVYGAAGALLAYSGAVAYDQREISLTVLKGGAVTFTNVPRLLSRWKIGPSAGVDRRLTLFVLPYNEAADIE